jgi:hypothetical protein
MPSSRRTPAATNASAIAVNIVAVGDGQAPVGRDGVVQVDAYERHVG